MIAQDYEDNQKSDNTPSRAGGVVNVTGDISESSGIIIGQNITTGDINIGYHDPYTVAYCAIEVDHIEPSNTLLQIADAINLKLNHEGQDYPFIFPKDFEKLQSENKVFLYGITGSGKNRLIYEIIKDKITSFNKVYLIPRGQQEE
jgi:hypothetical protein